MRRPFVSSLIGILALPSLAWAQPAPIKDAALAGRKFMHRGTFAGQPGGGWARDDVELEATYSLKGLDPKRLYEILRAEPGSGNPVRGDLFSDQNNFRELRRTNLSEAFAIGYPIDEIPWDADRHRIREMNPHVWLSIESGNFEIDETRRVRRLTLGTDVMDDTYYDTRDYTLLDNRFSVRARKRWDNPDETRRILIGLKRESGVDELGIKRAAKTDVRNDGASAEDLAGMDEAMRTGLARWDGTPEPVQPLRELHSRLDAAGKLPSSESYSGVLVLEPKAALRSVRSRYHLNETRLQSIRELHELGATRLRALAAMAGESRMAGAIPAAREAEVRAFEAKIARVLDRSLVAERAAARLRELDPSFVATADSIAGLMPAAPALQGSRDLADLAAREVELGKREVVANAVSDLYHELARDLDDGSSESVRRLITRSLDRTLEPHATWFRDWQRQKDMAKLGPITTWDRFVEIHNLLLDDAVARAEYNAFGEAQRAANRRPWRDFTPVDEAGWAAIRAQLLNEQARIWGRQVEAAGSAAKGLWFDQARAFYVPDSRRSTGNFLIDTVDFTMAYTADVWDGVPDAERTPKFQLDESKLVNVTLSNDVQIELGQARDYLERLDGLAHGHERAVAFMRWGESIGHVGSDAWRRLRDELLDKDEESLARDIAAIGSFARANGLAWTPVEADSFGPAILPELLTPEIRDGARDARVDVALAGARFVFERYRDQQANVARLKEEKIRETLEDAGVPAASMSWGPIEGAKGDMALKIIRAGGSAPADTTGIIDVLDGASPLANADNHTQANAAALTRGTHSGLSIGAGERDWYKLDLKSGESATFTIRFDHAGGAGDLDLSIHRADGTRIDVSRTTTNEETLAFTAPADGPVWVRVYGKPNARAGYSMEVR